MNQVNFGVFATCKQSHLLSSRQALFISSHSLLQGRKISVFTRSASKRVFKKLFLLICKIALFVSLLIPVIFFCIKILVSCSYVFRNRKITTQSSATERERVKSLGESEKEINIFPETLDLLRKCIRGESVGEVKEYISSHRHRVFSLETAPDLVFKTLARGYFVKGEGPFLEKRFQKMLFARTVCRTHQLGLLVIPRAKLLHLDVNGKVHTVIVEEKLDVDSYGFNQRHYFRKYADQLTEAIRQLALFICKTGYSDVEWRNNPAILSTLNKDGNAKIALFDIEEMTSAAAGLFGIRGQRRGLVGCVNEEQACMIETIAKKQGVQASLKARSFVEAFAKRKKELEREKKLAVFYKEHGVVRGDELPQLPPSFSAFGQGRAHELAVQIVSCSQQQLMKPCPFKSKQLKRQIVLRPPVEDLSYFREATVALREAGVLFSTIQMKKGGHLLQF